MPIRYVQTMGAVAGIRQWVNAVVIDCAKPSPMVLNATGRPALSFTMSKPVPITVATGGRPGLTFDTRKPVPIVITVRPTLTNRR